MQWPSDLHAMNKGAKICRDSLLQVATYDSPASCSVDISGDRVLQAAACMLFHGRIRVSWGSAANTRCHAGAALVETHEGSEEA